MAETERRVTCARCKEEIDVPPGLRNSDAVLVHYAHEHPEVLINVDRQQLSNQS